MRFGKYDVVRKIGAGGFGVVYEGFDSQLRRRVAIKTCTTTQPEARERFTREASIGGNLQHRNITVVYDYGEQDGTPYMVQEYLTGEDLKQTIERRIPLSFATKLLYLIQAARGLGHAHRHGVIHRDIKPSNLRVLADGVVKIMDFGIARSDDIDISLTATGETVGTASYLAPEQIRAEELDGRCDIYALGIVAYELFTYERAFTGKSPSQVLYAALNQMPPPIQEKWPDCPERLQTTLERCYRKDREQRFQNCDQLLAALGGLLQAEQEDVPTEPPTMPDQVARSRKGQGQTVPSPPRAESSKHDTGPIEIDTGPIAIDDQGRPRDPEPGDPSQPQVQTPASGTRPAVRASPEESGRREAPTSPDRKLEDAEPAQALLSRTPTPERHGMRRPANDHGSAGRAARTGMGAGWLILLFLLMAIVGGAFAYWQHQSSGRADGAPPTRTDSFPDAHSTSPGSSADEGSADGLDEVDETSESAVDTAPPAEPSVARPPSSADDPVNDTGTIVVARAWSSDIELTIGRTPPRSLDREQRVRVPAGVPHRLQFSYFGPEYQTSEELTVTLRPGQTRRIRNPLPRPARLSVLSGGAEQVFVRLDGDALGWTPVQSRLVAPGERRVEVADAVVGANGGRTLSLSLRSGFETSVTIDLDSQLDPKVSARRITGS